ncbi:MAG: hypothetical protein KA371_08855 [Acidobacteria bacterium]|nr:hypothetical protein [Acidobacteriota bacterium]
MISRFALLGAFLAWPAAFDQTTRPSQARPDALPAAIVTLVQGTVESRQPPASALLLQRFDRIAAGTSVETAADASVILAFRSGARTRIDGGSHVRIETDGVTRLAGSVTPLARVPVVPLVAAVAGAGRVVAAVRVRADGIVVRTPDRGMTTTADATALVFEPVAANVYDVEIEDGAARIVWRKRVPASPARVPAGVLEPGHAYRWQVRAQTPAGFVLEGRGMFATLAAAETQARQALHAAVVTDDPSWPGLLAEVDYSLGLWAEALDAFGVIRDDGAADAAILGRIAELERRLAAPNRQER